MCVLFLVFVNQCLLYSQTVKLSLYMYLHIHNTYIICPYLSGLGVHFCVCVCAFSSICTSVSGVLSNSEVQLFEYHAAGGRRIAYKASRWYRTAWQVKLCEGRENVR